MALRRRPNGKRPVYAKPDSFPRARHHHHQRPLGAARRPDAAECQDRGSGGCPGAGSGPQDQDESIGPNKPFKDLAYGLASQNIAVLRYVKRTKQYGADSKSDAPFTVKDEVTDDAIAAVALLTKMPEINKKQIYVLGHSLGGMLVPRIAAEDPQVAGIIILAGTARPLEKVVVDQVKYIASLTQPKRRKTRSRSKKPRPSPPRSKARHSSPTRWSISSARRFPGSYFLDLRNYDPGKVAAGLRFRSSSCRADGTIR